MADTTPIIKINIDAEEFDRFTERFYKYRESLEDLPAQWADQNEQVERTVASMTKLADLSKTEKKPLDPRIEKADEKKSLRLKEDAKSWAKIQKHATTTGKEVSGLARMTIGISSGGKLAGLGGGLGLAGAFAALYSAGVKSGNDLSNRNLTNRSLNLAPGVVTAYGKVFQKVGGGEDQLARFETAKMNPDQWQGLLAAGLTPDEIQTDDAETLAETFMQRGSQRFKEMPESVRGTWMRQTGVSNFASETDMNLASSYTPDDWAKMHSEFLTQRDKVADSQPDLDRGTELKTHLGENWDAISRAFDHAAIQLAPALEMFSDAATKLTVKFFDGIPGALKDAEDFNDKYIAPNLPKPFKGGDKLDDAAIDIARQVTDKNGWKRLWNGIKNSGIRSGGAPINPVWDMDHPFGVWRHQDTPAGGTGGDDPRHNPGNMRPPGDGKHFLSFTSDAEGVRAADRQIQLYYTRDHISTADGFANKWAPASDGNHPREYAAFLAKGMGVKTNDELDFNDPRVRAKFESLVFQVESGKHRDLTPEKVLAMYDPDYRDTPKAGAPKTDETPHAVKAASDGPRDMTIYAEDDPVLKAHAETHRVLKQIATQKIDPQIIQIDSDGKDSKMPPILERPSGMGSQPANVNLDVRVYAPPGSSVAVTSSNLPR